MTRAGANAQGDSNPTIGILTTRFGNLYSSPVVAGVAAVMREQGVNVVCFAGGSPSPPGEPDGESAFYDLAAPVSVDGVVFLSGLFTQISGALHSKNLRIDMPSFRA